MNRKIYFLISFILVLALNGAVQGGAPLPVENHSFEEDANGIQITEQEWIGDVNAWILRDIGQMGGWWFASVGENFEGFEAADGNVASVTITIHDPCGGVILELYQILDPNLDANAIIAVNRRYTLTFNATDMGYDAADLDVNAALFTSVGVPIGEGEPNDRILVKKSTTLTAPSFGEPGYTGWEEIKLTYTALAGDANIGRRIGVKFNVPVPWYNGAFVGIDNVRMDWDYLSDAWAPSPDDEATDVPKDVGLIWSPGLWVKSVNGHDVYFGSTWAEVNSATTDSNEWKGVQSPNSFDPTPGANVLTLGETYYWRIDEVNEGYTPGPVPAPPNGKWKGDIWSFTVEGLAKNPHPEDRAKDVPKNVILRWTRGAESLYHDVYFGSTDAEVTAATTGSGEYKTQLNKGTELYDTGANEDLTVDEKYFWRIDEVNLITVKGYTWEFKVIDYMLVDDFDFYVNHDAQRQVWQDWLSGHSSNSEVWVNKDPNWAVDGNSMLFKYFNNTNPKYSETLRTYSSGQDWSYAGNGVTALEIDFFGDVNNAPDPPMYVKLSDGSTTVQVNPGPNDVTDESQHTWLIPLKDFSPVTLSSITAITLGIGDKAGEGGPPAEEGTLYFDNIRLYPPRCAPEITGTAYHHAVGDFTTAHEDGQDCITDCLDLEIMAERDWLMSGANVPPSAPDTNATLWYRFDEGSGTTTANSGDLGSAYNGRLINGPPVWSTDAHPNDGNSLDFDGTDDGVYVDGSPDMTGDNTVSFTAWVKREADISAYSGIIVISRDEGSEGDNGTGIHTDRTGTNALGYTWNNWEPSWQWESGLVIPLNEWAFVALTVEPTQGIMYLAEPNAADANIYDLSSATNAWGHDGLSEFGDERGGWDGNSPIYLGRDDPNKGSPYTFPGKISDIRVYDYTLSRGQIMYLAGVSGTAYVPLDDWRADIDDDDRVDLTDYSILAKNWLDVHLWPEP